MRGPGGVGAEYAVAWGGGVVGGWQGPGVANVALLGQGAAEFGGKEHAVALTYAGRAVTLEGVGRIKTGGDEDSRIYMPLAAFTAWTGVGPSVIELQVPGGAARVEATMAKLQEGMPGVQGQPGRRVVEGEWKMVGRTEGLVDGAVLLIGRTVGVR